MDTWKCPICNGRAPFDDLRLDGFFHQVLQSIRLPEDAQDIVLSSNGPWKASCSKDNDVQVDEIDLTEEVNVPLSGKSPPIEKNQPRRLMESCVTIKRLSNSELLWFMSQSSQSDEVKNSSLDLTEDEHLILDLSEEEDQVVDNISNCCHLLSPVTADEDLDEIPISAGLPFLEDVPNNEVIVIFSMISMKYK